MGAVQTVLQTLVRQGAVLAVESNVYHETVTLLADTPWRDVTRIIPYHERGSRADRARVMQIADILLVDSVNNGSSFVPSRFLSHIPSCA